MGFTTPGRIDPEVSRGIRILRTLLISGLVFVHIPTGGIPDMPPEGASFRLVRVLLGEVVFMGSLPMLGVVSGYLYAARPHRYPKLILRKIRSLLVPLFCWSAPLAALICLLARAGVVGGSQASYLPPFDPMAFADASLALTRPPANAPLYFLRDLFVCFLLGPVLLSLARRLFWPGFLLLLVPPLLGVATGVWIRGDIPLWFYLGAGLRLHMGAPFIPPTRRRQITGLYVPAVLALTGLCVWVPLDPHGMPFQRLVLALRFLSLPVFWILAGTLDRSKAGPVLAEASTFAFFLFCSHMPVLTHLWALVRIAEPDFSVGHPWYPAFFLGSWTTTLAVALVGRRALFKIHRPLLSVLEGGRPPG